MSNQNIESESVSMKFTVNTYDIDAAGHLNNIVYVRWLEDLRNKLFEKIFDFKKLIEAKYYPVVIFTEINYKRQIKLFEEPEGVMWIYNKSHGVYFLEAKITVDNVTAALAIQRCVILDLKTNKIIVNPKL